MKPIVRDDCLNFSKFNLISGASRETEDCSWQVYWADGNNPDRYINIGDPKLWPSDDYIWSGGLDGSLTVNYYINGVNKMLWPGVAWVEDCNEENDCIICTLVNDLNCDKIRLASLVKTPCIDVSISPQQGSLLNGSYTFGHGRWKHRLLWKPKRAGRSGCTVALLRVCCSCWSASHRGCFCPQDVHSF